MKRLIWASTRAHIVHGTRILARESPGAQLVIRVRAREVFPNCPRYIHRMQMVEASPYVPTPGCTPPVPGWKKNAAFKDYLPQPRE